MVSLAVLPFLNSTLLEPHASTAAIFGNELDASGFKGSAHLVDAADPRVLARLEPIDGIHPNASGGGKLLCSPIEGGAGHSALNRLHTVKLSPFKVDSNPATGLPLVV